MEKVLAFSTIVGVAVMYVLIPQLYAARINDCGVEMLQQLIECNGGGGTIKNFSCITDASICGESADRGNCFRCVY
jgi:hypothetical protein